MGIAKISENVREAGMRWYEMKEKWLRKCQGSPSWEGGQREGRELDGGME